MVFSSQTIGCRADEYITLFSTPRCRKFPSPVAVPYNLEPARAPFQVTKYGLCALPALTCLCLCFSLYLQLKRVNCRWEHGPQCCSPLDRSSALISGCKRPHVRLLHFGGNEVGNREQGVRGKWKRRKSWDWSEWGDWAERREQITGVTPTPSQAPFAAVFTVRWSNSMAIALPVGGPGAVVSGKELRDHFILLKTQLLCVQKVQLGSQYLEMLWYIF